ncbi:MAG: phosphatidylglycerophosphatase A [Acidobacteria bacterium]|nr:phosphatidylglycerophosphatase A [Acidobacteriota bacterium]NIM62199.1 phosphatidylglycerophosphatase A [Acidobacteriota bacterium]NIO59818.1 phosphatidylglycerophosphatase A [Acidobacteriota bacterium]NIQ30901.1 phosphatidylglycerophosphatase A [Acidobacteriota bacterium]NIQ85977.1 phosphatidylglycerophosphatase A [Acidobacteriota bacterium]
MRRDARYWLATGLGSGLVPIAPGTAGSAVAVGLVWVASRGGPWWPVIVFAALLPLGWWSAAATARSLGKKDPGVIVIDEFAGQFLALLALPPVWPVLLGGFVLFRLFDIVKPPPARRLEALRGATGIMADDLVAGLYANLLLQLAVRLGPGVWGLG